MNIKARFKNPYFWTGAVALFLATVGIDPITLSTWGSVGDMLIAFIQNPYKIGLVIVAFVGILIDPSTGGFKDDVTIEYVEGEVGGEDD